MAMWLFRMTTGAFGRKLLQCRQQEWGAQMSTNWRDRAATSFECQKQPASSSRGMVVSNHPLASSAGGEMLARFGTMSLADVMQPAIKHAARGYAATPYLHECIADGAEEMRKDKAISAIYLPNGVPLKAGERVVQSEYAETLTYIAQHG